MPASLDLATRLAVAIELARQVGRAANTFRATADTVALQVENKGLQDFVTIADRQAEQTIRAEVAAHFPEDGFVGEEGGGAQAGQATWVVDPIDGTTNFIRGFRHWGVSLAVAAAGKVQIGVVYDAAVDQVYSACRGGGAHKDGSPIEASGLTDPRRALAILGHSRRTDFEDYLKISRSLYDLGVDYRRMGAGAIGLVRVADGIADLYFEAHLYGWDMLAGALIAQEAGALVLIPPLQRALGSGGPVLAVAAGLDAKLAFLHKACGVGVPV